MQIFFDRTGQIEKQIVFGWKTCGKGVFGATETVRCRQCRTHVAGARREKHWPFYALWQKEVWVEQTWLPPIFEHVKLEQGAGGHPFHNMVEEAESGRYQAPPLGRLPEVFLWIMPCRIFCRKLLWNFWEETVENCRFFLVEKQLFWLVLAGWLLFF